MCAVCDKLPEVYKKGVKAVWNEIEVAVRAGMPVEHFKDAIDKFLGTAEPERDEDWDRTWEYSHRRQS